MLTFHKLLILFVMLYKSTIEPLFRYMYVIHILYDVYNKNYMRYLCSYNIMIKTCMSFQYNTFTHHLHYKNSGQYLYTQQPTQQGPASQISGQETTLY